VITEAVPPEFGRGGNVALAAVVPPSACGQVSFL